jgi:hypothetical protein
MASPAPVTTAARAVRDRGSGCSAQVPAPGTPADPTRPSGRSQVPPLDEPAATAPERSTTMTPTVSSLFKLSD